MDERLRFVARLLDGEKMAALCREFDVSRKTGYKIFQRYKDCGLDGLTDRSRRPYRHANQLPLPIEKLIVQLKRERPSWGAPKIREKLRRLHSDIQTPAISTVHAVHSAVAWANANSRNLALATSTLLAAVILVATQLAFELQSRSNSDFFSAEFFVDRKTPQIRHWDYENFSGWRMATEIEASNFLAAKDRARFDGDREQLTRDMVMFSLVSYLAAEQYDWQIKRTVYQGTMSTQVSTERLSKLDECTITTKDRLKEQLLAARNSFADAEIHIIGANLCLPPESVLTIDDTSLKISTPYCTVAFQLQSSGGVSYMEPKSGGNVPSLINGEAQFETRITGVRANIEYSWIRAQSRDMKKYEEWSERLIKGARLWFEGEAKARST